MKFLDCWWAQSRTDETWSEWWGGEVHWLISETADTEKWAVKWFDMAEDDCSNRGNDETDETFASYASGGK